MRGEVDSPALDHDPFTLEAAGLFPGSFPGHADHSAGTQHSVPRELLDGFLSQDAANHACPTRKTRFSRNLSIGGDTPGGDRINCGEDALDAGIVGAEHVLWGGGGCPQWGHSRATVRPLSRLDAVNLSPEPDLLR